MFFEGGIPFGFGGMPGGVPGGMGGRGGSPANVDNKKFYELLGLEKTATDAEIKKAYRKLAMQHHPDRGGDAELFKEISKAYEVLSNEEKRKIYDQYGEEGLEGGAGGPGMDASDIFSAMFGGGGSRGPRVRKTEDITHHLRLTLSQLYSGVTKRVSIKRELVCTGCKGKGAPADKIRTCADCKGQGHRVVIQRMGPMVTQSMQPCRACRGEGSSFPPSERCTDCTGKGVIEKQEILEVRVEAGAVHGAKIVFEGKADERPGFEPGNLVFIVAEVEHEVYKRKGEHLFINRKISLLESLTGFEFLIEHVDGRKILVKSPESKVVKPGSVMVLSNEGMPIAGRPYQHGHIAVTIDVEFPTSVDAAFNENLAKALGGASQKVTLTDDMEEHTLVDGSNLDLSGKAGKSSHAYDEDDDDHHHHPGNVQCAQA